MKTQQFHPDMVSVLTHLEHQANEQGYRVNQADIRRCGEQGIPKLRSEQMVLRITHRGDKHNARMMFKVHNGPSKYTLDWWGIKKVRKRVLSH